MHPRLVEDLGEAPLRFTALCGKVLEPDHWEFETHAHSPHPPSYIRLKKFISAMIAVWLLLQHTIHLPFPVYIICPTEKTNTEQLVPGNG